jgi:magnesium chelatase subunit D
METIRAAAPHQHARGRIGSLQFRADDLRLAVKEGHESNLILFCVDASGSMAARKRMEQVKTAILSLLMDAYQRRDKVGLITFRQDGADLALPPTGSIDIAAARLADLPAGGRTPLAEALLKTADVLRLERVRDPRRRPLLVVITDGRATHGPDAVNRSRQAAGWIAEQGISAVVVDCEQGPMRLGLAGQLAQAMQASHLPIAEVSAAYGISNHHLTKVANLLVHAWSELGLELDGCSSAAQSLPLARNRAQKHASARRHRHA